MDINLLRKRLKEIQDRIASGAMPAVPGMENLSQPAAPQPVETYNPPEVNVPTAQPKTTPVSTSPVTQTNNPAVNIPKPTAKMTSNKPKVDPKTGANGAKTFDDITARSPQFGEEGMGHDGLIDAYNAGLNGEDMSRETRDNAAAGGYLEQLEAMYNAGRQDAKGSPTNNKASDGLSTEAAREEKFSQKSVDNQVKSGYTSGNTTENTGMGKDTTDEEIPRMGDDTSKQSAKTGNTTSGDKPYTISDEEKELNYMMDMMFMNGAASSNDPSVQEAYQWLLNPNKKLDQDYNEKLKKAKEAFYSFMGGINDDQIARSNKIADGKNESKMYKKILNGTYETRSPWMPDENYYKQMMALNGAGESADPNVRRAYTYLTDPKNKGMLPKDIKDIFYNFMASIQDEDQKIRAYEVTTGIDLKGLYEDEKIKTGPYAGKVVSGGFNDPGTNNQGHMAYDIKGSYGSYIHPILDGKIVYITDSNSTGNGRMVVIEHELPNGTKYYSSYSHLSDVEGLEVGMQVSKSSNIGKMGGSAWGDDHYFGSHVHLMVYTREKPYETPYILDPHGYASKVLKEGTQYHKFNFEDAGCTYGQYYCITHNYKGKINDYNSIVFYDPNIVMLTNGEIINLFPYKYVKKE